MEEFKKKMNRYILKLLVEEQNAEEIHNMNSFKSKKYFDVEYDLDKLMLKRKGDDYQIKFDKQLIAEDETIQLENKRIECEQNLIKLRIIVK